MAGAHLSAGVIDYAGANTPGWISNLGCTYAAGVFKIVDAQGAALTQSNPGWVTVPSTTAGLLATLKVTSQYTFYDDAHASSDLGNLGFGITEAAAWANDMPFFIYVVNKGNTNLDGTTAKSSFFISRNPALSTTSSVEADIHDTAALSANDTQASILVLAGLAPDNSTKTDMDNTDYESLPCQLIGALRMQWSTVTDDWTVQALGNSDGLGHTQVNKTLASDWTMPLSQNGAAAGTYLLDNLGTAPIFTTNTYLYKLDKDGVAFCTIHLSGDGGGDGVGAVTAKIALPYTVVFVSTRTHDVPAGSATGATTITNGTMAMASFKHGDLFVSLTYQSAAVTNADIQNGMFTNGNRSVSLSFQYRAF